jgi:integrase
LRWSDLDLDAGRAAIRQTVIAVKHTAILGTPKIANGRRTVTLDGGTVAALREHRKRQAAERLLMGAGWTDIDLVFCHVDGTMPHPERFTRILRRRAPARTASAPATRSAARVGDVGAAGRIHPKVVQERLGHANIGITLGTYSTSSRGCMRTPLTGLRHSFVSNP